MKKHEQAILMHEINANNEELIQLNTELRAKIKFLRGEIPEWISASKPPDSDRDVLLYMPDAIVEIQTAYYADDREWMSSGRSPIETEVTHWMELPEKPESE